MLPLLAHDLPAVHLLYLSEVLKQHGVAPVAFYASFGIDEAALAHPGASVPLDVVERVVDAARGHCGAAFGVFVGMQIRASVFGQVGIAASSAPTVRESLATLLRFAPLVTDTLALRFSENEAAAVLTIEENVAFGRARDVVLFAITVGLWQMTCVGTGRPVVGALGFAFPAPSYAADVQGLAAALRCTVAFDQPANTLSFDAGLLDWPLVLVDLAGHRLACEECERALAARPSEARVLQDVRAFLAQHDKDLPSLEDAAAVLHLSPRTLKRRLNSHGRTYSDLVDETRRERATALLTSSALAIKEVAERLGYSEVANFTRAFRRWTGVSPAVFRRARVVVGAPPDEADDAALEAADAKG